MALKESCPQESSPEERNISSPQESRPEESGPLSPEESDPEESSPEGERPSVQLGSRQDPRDEDRSPREEQKGGQELMCAGHSPPRAGWERARNYTWQKAVPREGGILIFGFLTIHAHFKWQLDKFSPSPLCPRQ